MKQVIVVDASLALPPGKLAVQVAHASVCALLKASLEEGRVWRAVGMPKVVLRCDGEVELCTIAASAEAAGLPTELIRDAGRTVLAVRTLTCVGIGPAENGRIDAITGALSLHP